MDKIFHLHEMQFDVYLKCIHILQTQRWKMKKILLFLAVALLVFAMAVGCSSDSEKLEKAPENIFEVKQTERVIYISDSAKPGGQGTSADDPLYPTILPNEKLEPQTVDQTQSDGSKKSITLYSYYKNILFYHLFFLSILLVALVDFYTY